MSTDEIVFYRVAQKSMDRIECYLEVENNLALIKAKVKVALQTLFERYDIPSVAIDFTEEFRLGKGEKLKRVINEHSKTF